MDNGKGRLVLITGASAGIGEAFAHVFASRSWNLVITARREDRLLALASKLSADHGVQVTCLAKDLSIPSSVAELVDELNSKGLKADGLVNNAGYAVPGHFARTLWDDQAKFIRVLVTAPCELTHALLPGMIERGWGRILNVASVAGLVPGSAGHTLYGAAKAFMVKFSQSLLVENERYNVLTTALCPGFTYSEFHDVTGTRAKVSRMGKAWWSTAEDVAVAGYDGVMNGKAIVVTGRRSKQVVPLMKVLPDSWALAIMRRRSKAFRNE